MNFIRGPKATYDVLKAIERREKTKQIVTRVTISPNLHTLLVDEAWQYHGQDVEYIGNFMNIPVVISTQLNGNEFFLDTEQGEYRNDA